MIPIGILTHNRPVYLDVTLRSLSATDLPPDAAVIIYDDGSEDAVAQRHLQSSDTFVVPHQWPRTQRWHDAGLDILQDDPLVHGIANVLEVARIGDSPSGVVLASCFAISDLFCRFEQAGAVILLQDDIVLKEDWYQRLIGQLGRSVCSGSPQGLVAGMHLDARLLRRIKRTTVGVPVCTAQCYLITRALFDASREWFDRTDLGRVAFDGLLCRHARRLGFEVRLVFPYICQHIGVVSAVRPEWEFHTSNRGLGRLARGAVPPYALDRMVHSFHPMVRRA